MRRKKKNNDDDQDDDQGEVQTTNDRESEVDGSDQSFVSPTRRQAKRRNDRRTEESETRVSLSAKHNVR